MAAGAALVISALSGYYSYKSQEDAAKAQKKAAELAAQKAIEAAALAKKTIS